jgi:hypothetical protein
MLTVFKADAPPPIWIVPAPPLGSPVIELIRSQRRMIAATPGRFDGQKLRCRHADGDEITRYETGSAESALASPRSTGA